MISKGIDNRILSHLRTHFIKKFNNGSFDNRKNFHIACLVTSQGDIVQTRKGHILLGVNHQKTHPIMTDFKRNKKFKNTSSFGVEMTQHAEVNLLVKYLSSYRTSSLEGLSMCVARFSKSTLKPLQSCPCVGCQDKLKPFNLKGIYHT